MGKVSGIVVEGGQRLEMMDRMGLCEEVGQIVGSCLVCGIVGCLEVGVVKVGWGHPLKIAVGVAVVLMQEVVLVEFEGHPLNLVGDSEHQWG